MSATTGITREDIRDETIKNQQIAPDAAISESKIQHDPVNGHRHDGIDSYLINGGSGGDTWVVDASFTGAIDDVNVTFTFAQNFRANTVAVYRQGVRQKRGPHFTESAPNQITFSTPPKTGQTLVFDFILA
jgi:hypothetical protein